MNDLLELELRAAFNTRLESLSDEREARLCAFDYRSRTRRYRRLWAAIGASGTALVGGIVTAILLLSSGASVAYAGWSAVPSTATPAALATVTTECNQALHHPGLLTAGQALGQPVLSETRGQYTALVYPTSSYVYDCIANGTGAISTGYSSLTTANQGAIPTPGADQISNVGGGAGAAPGFPGGNPDQPIPQSWLPPHSNESKAFAEQSWHRLLAEGVESSIFGMAGSDVSAVTFDFAGGLTVDATIQNGWYFAWWPGLDDGPTSVQITTASGQTHECSGPSVSGSPDVC